RRQHRRCRRLQPVRLPPGRCPGRYADRAAGLGRGVRQRSRRPRRDDRPQPLADPPRPGHGASAQSFHWSNDMTEMITRDLVRLDATLGADKLEVIHGLAAVVAEAGRTADQAQLIEDALAREATSPTGLPGGIAIPHCRTTAVEVPTLAFARLSPAVEFGAKDGPADLAFLIAAPAGGDATHLKVPTQLARALVKKALTDGLRGAANPEEVVTLVQGVVGDSPA